MTKGIRSKNGTRSLDKVIYIRIPVELDNKITNLSEGLLVRPVDIVRLALSLGIQDLEQDRG